MDDIVNAYCNISIQQFSYIINNNYRLFSLKWFKKDLVLFDNKENALAGCLNQNCFILRFLVRKSWLNLQIKNNNNIIVSDIDCLNQHIIGHIERYIKNYV